MYAKATGPRGASVSSVRRGTKRRQARALLGGLALGPTLMDGLACMARAHLRPPGLQASTAPAQLARCTEQLCEHSTSRGAMGHSTTRTPHRAHATVLGLELIPYAHAKPLRTRNPYATQMSLPFPVSNAWEPMAESLPFPVSNAWEPRPSHYPAPCRMHGSRQKAEGSHLRSL